MSVDLSKGATVELVKTLSDDIRTLPDGTKAEKAGAVTRLLMETKAETDGTYPDMTVGNVSSEDSATEDKTPYLYRVSGGGVEVGKVEADKIVGGSVAWNQLYDATTGTSQTNQGITFTKNDSIWEVVGTATALTLKRLHGGSFPMQANHVYMVKGCPSGGGNNYRLDIRDTDTSSVIDALTDTGSGRIGKLSESINGSLNIQIGNGTEIATAIKFIPQLFDLTAMFGSTIADYIFNLETATAGAGVAFFRKMFPNAYYPYNAGELKSVEGLTSHDMVGKNILNPSVWISNKRIRTDTGNAEGTSSEFHASDHIPVVPNTTYTCNWSYYSSGNYGMAFYDESKSFISGLKQSSSTQTGKFPFTFTTPANARYIRLSAYSTVFSDQMQIEIGSTATAYEPYEKHSYPLDSSLTLRGIPKVADGKMYYDGDVYSSDGKVQRKYGIVDLGTLNWSYDSAVQRFSTEGLVNQYKWLGSRLTPFMSSMYVTLENGQTFNVNWNMVIYAGSEDKNILIHNHSYTDPATFKAAMSGVYLVYELATPTEETAEQYTEYQKVSKGGTEEYVSTGIVPVGHITKYPTDIVSKVDGLPSDFSTLIAPTEKGFTATRAYTVNDLLIVNNTLYKVTANIANGATITVGTNVQQTTLSALIKALSA